MNKFSETLWRLPLIEIIVCGFILYSCINIATANDRLNDDVYGPGIGQDKYGRPVERPPGMKVRPDVYGPGVHADQYGRRIEVKPVQPGQWALKPYGETQ